ncbi:hypothetical protein [Sinomicrobium soli]|uniref:hypothetical protein n=1 Tax=Sinomicrobium sp. N-1-3-6 TaxID=2219864 RepID=UPI000DCDC204|nr:hypothetical protein [Sinomicrobium sp. N-1-3-6]RAV27506.1 hypothetical protein DN748_18265 [Sinomicrobium sp. N-1-3-6]
MENLFKKLKLEDQKEILILNEPEGFSQQLAELTGIDIYESLVQVNKVEFALVFVTTIRDFEQQMLTLGPKLKDDVVLWVAHPRTISAHFDTDITDAYDWGPLTRNAYDAVNTLTINEDWEAIRFRKTEYANPLYRNREKDIKEKN